MALFELLNNHFYSYNRNKCSKKIFVLLLLSSHNIFNEDTSNDFYSIFWFWQDQLEKIVENMKLIQEKIAHPYSYCYNKKIYFSLYFRNSKN